MISTWEDITSSPRYIGPELYGSLALAMDQLGDSYLIPPIERWLESTESRRVGVPKFGIPE
jgi:hypothetical protein